MNKNKAFLLIYGVLFALLPVSCSGDNPRKIVLLETTDLHGMIFPYDYIEKRTSKNSLAAIAGYIRKVDLKKNELILLDNGDNLQGQPVVYYYNFEDTISAHINSLVMNYMEYDAMTVGNHDIEAGHPVYDRLRDEYNFPMLAANAVDIKTGKPYFEPFTVINRNGIKVAVLGLITSSVPEWLPADLYSGIEFRDMLETAKIWMPIIMSKKPDLVVGLFHSGWDKNSTEENYIVSESESNLVAYHVPGFDVIFTGHDHAVANEKIINIKGDTILILDGGSRGEIIARADITIDTRKHTGRKVIKAEGSIVNVEDYLPDSDFLNRFAKIDKTVRNYGDKVIGELSLTISSRESYFGPSPFMDLIHSLQLKISGAEISFAAPLSFDAEIKKGPVTISDMFKLYRFENMLYTVNLSGREILGYLEYSYAGWFNSVKDTGDYLINFRTGSGGKPVISGGRAMLKIPPYNFDSAAGIDYTVDVRKPAGNRIEVKSFSDGRPFNLNDIYKVALNSYRGSGGGGHLTVGSGLSGEELKSRLISSTQRDLRYFIIESIENANAIFHEPLRNWRIIPENFAESAKRRESELMFGN